MANMAYYWGHIVAKEKGTVERVMRIINGEDQEYAVPSLCWCADRSGEEDPIIKNGEFWEAFVEGETAWGINQPFEDIDDGKMYQSDRRIATLLRLSGRLGFAVEMWSEECGIGLAQHYVCSEGRLPIADDCGWYDPMDTDDKDELRKQEADVRESFELTEEDEKKIKEIWEYFRTHECGTMIACGGYDWADHEASEVWNGTVPHAVPRGVHNTHE